MYQKGKTQTLHLTFPVHIVVKLVGCSLIQRHFSYKVTRQFSSLKNKTCCQAPNAMGR